METITFIREIPIKKQADVFIAGGGPAGIAAAVTAARMGATGLSGRKRTVLRRGCSTRLRSCLYAFFRWGTFSGGRHRTGGF